MPEYHRQQRYEIMVFEGEALIRNARSSSGSAGALFEYDLPEDRDDILKAVELHESNALFDQIIRCLECRNRIGADDREPGSGFPTHALSESAALKYSIIYLDFSTLFIKDPGEYCDRMLELFTSGLTLNFNAYPAPAYEPDPQDRPISGYQGEHDQRRAMQRFSSGEKESTLCTAEAAAASEETSRAAGGGAGICAATGRNPAGAAPAAAGTPDAPVHVRSFPLRKTYMPFERSGSMSRKSVISFIDRDLLTGEGPSNIEQRLSLGMDFSKISLIPSRYFAYRGLYMSDGIRIDEAFPESPESLCSAERVQSAGSRMSEESLKDQEISDSAEGPGGVYPERSDSFVLNESTVIVLPDTIEDPGGSGERYSVRHILKNQSVITIDKHAYMEQGGRIQPPGGLRDESGNYTWDLTKDLELEAFDGEGIISPAFAAYISDMLQPEESGRARSFQIRMPFAKGMLHEVDFHRFYREFLPGINTDELYIVDAFGIRRSLPKARIILTESMFKCSRWLGFYCRMQGMGDPMKYYFERFHAYSHAMYIVGTDLSLAGRTKTRLSYQMLNTLDMEGSVFDSMVSDHIEAARSWSSYNRATSLHGDTLYGYADVPDASAAGGPLAASSDTYANPSCPGTSQKGVGEYVGEKGPTHMGSSGISWREALKANPEFINDSYIRERVMEERRAHIRDAALGRIVIDGCDRYLSDDLLRLLIYMLRCTDTGDSEKVCLDASGSPASFGTEPGCSVPESCGRLAAHENPMMQEEEEAAGKSSFAARKRVLIEYTLKPCCLKGNRFYLPDGAVLFKGGGAGECGTEPWNRYYGILRSPHLSRNEECAMRPFVTPVKDTSSRRFNICTDKEGHKTDIYSSYFSHLRGIVMISYLSSVPAALGGADYDGDIVKITADSRVNAAILKGAYREKNPGNFVRKLPVPLIISPSPGPERLPSLYMDNAPGSGTESISTDTGDQEPASVCRGEERTLSRRYYEKLFGIVYDTFSNRIGLISNAAIRISEKEYRGSEQGEWAGRCALCTIITGLEIDAAKNGIHPALPDWISQGPAGGAYDYPAVSKKLREASDLIRTPEAFETDDRGDSMIISRGGRKWMELVSGSGSNINRLPFIFFRSYKSDSPAESSDRARTSARSGREHLYFSFQLESDWEECVRSDSERLDAVRETVRAYARINSLVFEHSRFEELSSQYIRRARYLLDVEYDRREAAADGLSASGAAEEAFGILCAALSEDPDDCASPDCTAYGGTKLTMEEGDVSGAAGAADSVSDTALAETKGGSAFMCSAAEAGVSSDLTGPPEAADPVSASNQDQYPESLYAGASAALTRLRELGWSFQPEPARAQCLRKITGKSLGGAGSVFMDPFDDGYMLLFYQLNAVRYLPRTESRILRDLGSDKASGIYKQLAWICCECGIRKRMPRSTWQEFVREACRKELCRIFAGTCSASAIENGVISVSCGRSCGRTGYISGHDAEEEAAMEEALRYVYYLRKNREPGRADKFLWDIFDTGTIIRLVHVPEKEKGDRDCAGREA